MKPKNVRLVVVKLLQQVLQHGQSLSSVLVNVDSEFKDSRDSSLAKALVYGVLRSQYRLQAITELLLKKPFKPRDFDLYLILMIGLYQLSEQRVPDHAAVSSAVDAVKKSKKNWATGVINGALRNFAREREKYVEQLETNQEAYWAMPQWLIDMVRVDWPANCEDILAASNQQAPMTLRVNKTYMSVLQYIEQLAGAGYDATRVNQSDTAIQLVQPQNVDNLPGFKQGWVSVQDAAAQYAALLLATEKDHKVLDACAAPGGKTGHILESQPQLKSLTALDIDASRLDQISDNLARLGPAAVNKVKLVKADITDIDSWWDQNFYDRILLDVPCSATGVIRRHPDIKVLRKAGDIQALVETQSKILDVVWQTLKPGGILLYATCSILKCENECQIKRFLEDNSDAMHLNIDDAIGNQCAYGRQIFPGENNMDGFYYALIKKGV